MVGRRALRGLIGESVSLHLHATLLPPLQVEECLQLQDKNGWGHTQCCGNTYHFECLFSW